MCQKYLIEFAFCIFIDWVLQYITTLSPVIQRLQVNSYAGPIDMHLFPIRHITSAGFVLYWLY